MAFPPTMSISTAVNVRRRLQRRPRSIARTNPSRSLCNFPLVPFRISTLSLRTLRDRLATMFQFQFDFNLGPRLRPRHDASWEVVTTQSVEAARSPLDLDAAAHLPRRRRSTSPPSAHGAGVIDAAADGEHTRTYTFDLPARHGMPTTDDARRAVRASREQMVAELTGSGNSTHARASPTPGLAPTSFLPALSLSHERWSFAIMRKDEMYRIQVAYFARVTDHYPTAASPKTPPFLEVIDSRAW